MFRMGRVFKLIRFSRILMACLAAGTLQTLTGCQSAPAPARPDLSRGDVTAYVIADGWHTDIVLPVSAITGPLQTVSGDFPAARYLRFGWGERTWYMAQQPTTGDALRALFPAPAALLVTPLDRAPSSTSAGTHAFAVGLTTAGASRMADHIWAAFERPIVAIPGRFGFDREPGGIFYAANGAYNATYTCNTWAADTLRAGGIPVHSSGVIFAGQLTNQLGTVSNPVP
jgi:uncharacterized protein (TIGR02117 family)